MIPAHSNPEINVIHFLFIAYVYVNIKNIRSVLFLNFHKNKLNVLESQFIDVNLLYMVIFLSDE